MTKEQEEYIDLLGKDFDNLIFNAPGADPRSMKDASMKLFMNSSS
jgi:hypothetical protein